MSETNRWKITIREEGKVTLYVDVDSSTEAGRKIIAAAQEMLKEAETHASNEDAPTAHPDRVAPRDEGKSG